MAPLRHVEADYVRPFRLGQDVLVQLAIARHDKNVLSLGWVFQTDDGPGAFVQGQHIFLNASDGTPMDIPAAIKLALQLTNPDSRRGGV